MIQVGDLVTQTRAVRGPYNAPGTHRVCAVYAGVGIGLSGRYEPGDSYCVTRFRLATLKEKNAEAIAFNMEEAEKMAERLARLEGAAEKAMAAIETKRKPLLLRDRLKRRRVYIPLEGEPDKFGLTRHYDGDLCGEDSQVQVWLWPQTLEPLSPRDDSGARALCVILLAIAAAVVILQII